MIGRAAKGAMSAWMVSALFLIAAVILTGGSTVWAFLQYSKEKNTVETQVENAVAVAKKNQADSDAKNYQAQEKLPYRTFAGPSDYGSLSFNYPKTWSVYVDQDESTQANTYNAYLNPISVPPVSVQNQQFALRVTIQHESYATVLATYNNLIQQKQLTSTAVKVNGQDAVRLDGNFTTDIRGSAVLFKIRDTTVTIRTDADTFDTDYANIIQSIKFNS